MDDKPNGYSRRYAIAVQKKPPAGVCRGVTTACTHKSQSAIARECPLCADFVAKVAEEKL
jgi:hypothetical protein